ncbi:hypothetical protein CCDG5_0398 [[Clostridium] cellulosi]|jgi:GDSL-like Lipase/Acylhydrolase.|uniref:SGNH hydrolase-type esterase domain-containing protein n=1 Tax=[Clostridium] cellulosi TaxID=29343 RepID=A0A078KM08_9FIRM|nr:hypothetical protein CCDG5_0398 [[Clostridium] cellulosi]
MEWKTTWSYLLIDYNSSIGTIENLTQRTVFRNNLSGEKIRIRFSNLFSDKPLILESVVISKKERGGEEITNFTPVTYKGNTKITIEPRKEFYSDPVDFSINFNEDIVVSVYIKEKNDIYAGCSSWSAKCFTTRYGIGGDFTREQSFKEYDSYDVFPALKSDPNKSDEVIGFTSLEVYTDENVKTLSLFGDSITHMSYYSDALTDKLYKLLPGKITVLNRGISGNRLLHDHTVVPEIIGGGSIFGDAGVKRFEKDVYKYETPEYVIMLIGVNDFMHPYAFNHIEEVVTVDQYKEGCLKIIETAHRHSSKIFLGTIMPFRHEENDWFEKAEKLRLEANHFIRTQKVADGVIDFDSAVRDEENPQYIKDGLHLGDGLHPNTPGGIKMADAIPVEWFIK